MTEQQLQHVQTLLSDAEKALGVLRSEAEGRLLDADVNEDLPHLMILYTLQSVERAQNTLSAALGYLKRYGGERG